MFKKQFLALILEENVFHLMKTERETVCAGEKRLTALEEYNFRHYSPSHTSDPAHEPPSSTGQLSRLLAPDRLQWLT